MKVFFKGIVFVLITAVLFSLCLTPVVFATEKLPHSGGTPPDSAIGTEPTQERGLPQPPAATPSDAPEYNAPPEHNVQPEYNAPPEHSALPEYIAPGLTGDDGMELIAATPSVAVRNVLPEADTVSTGEELFQWLSGHGDTGGTVKLTDDIYLRDFIYVHGFRQPEVIIDTGEFSIIVDGYAELHAGSPLIIRGAGGEKGVLRPARGGMLQVNGLTLEAEEGYAVFQEEGAGFLIEQTSVSGAVHYAELPYVLEWEDVLVVEERGQSFDVGHLPAVLRARVIRRGQITDFYEEVPVTWDLTGHEEEQKQRRRFLVSGEFENKASQKAPVCTIIYDDFPLTFLEVSAKRIAGGQGDIYKFTGAFSKPEGRLPMNIAQEYSFDGENWILYEEKEISCPSDTFTIYLSAEAGEESPPDIFIRLSWDDDGSMYYSNVLCFAEDSLEESGDHGGNRGGGTDIVDPPGTPESDPEPDPSEPEDTPPPDTSEPEDTPPPGTSEPEDTPPPGTSEPEGTPPPDTSEPEDTPPPGTLEPEDTPPPGTSEPEGTLPPGTSEPEDTLPPGTSEPEDAPPPGTSEPEDTLPPGTSEPEDTPPPGSSELEGILPPGSPESASAQPGHRGNGHEAGGSGEEKASSPEAADGYMDTQEPSHVISLTPDLSDGLSGSRGGQAPSAMEPASGGDLEPFSARKIVNHLAGAEEKPESLSDEMDAPPSGPLPAPAPPSSEDSREVSAELKPESALQRPDALSAVAGLASIAASIGGAALCLYPKMRIRLVEKLWNIFKR